MQTPLGATFYFSGSSPHRDLHENQYQSILPRNNLTEMDYYESCLLVAYLHFITRRRSHPNQ